MTDDEIRQRIAMAGKMRADASISQRIAFDDNENPVLLDTRVERERNELLRNQKRKKLSKNASRGLSKNHESNKHNRFARDEDFGA